MPHAPEGASINDVEAERLSAILDSWHKIEFFIPFDLGATVVAKTKQRDLRMLSPGMLESRASLFTFEAPEEYATSSYDLYLGVFDIAETQRICDASLGILPVGDDAYEDAERGTQNGDTCIARIRLNAHGAPIIEETSVSTLPWALGTVRRKGLDGLSAQAFNRSLKDLYTALWNFEADRSLCDMAEPQPPLNGPDVARLAALLFRWADFEPQRHPLVGLLKRNVVPEQFKRPFDSQPMPPEDDAMDDEESQPEEPCFDILNSFFIRDIERTMDDLRDHGVSRPLLRDLTPVAERTDLFRDEGRRTILDALHPRFLNRGHWFGNPEHTMSMMQQFAINTALQAEAGPGLFSVNGPPGTGKTTLLRDLFADNIVRRARALSEFETAGAALTARTTPIPTNGQFTHRVRRLHPALTGFEMVVASSNNAAVENISSELPRSTAIDACWRQDASYLRPTAQRIAARKIQGRLLPPAKGDARWGLISCVLGKAANRYRFRNRFYRREPGEPGELLGIVDWIDAYDGPSFAEARNVFLEKERRLEAEMDQLLRHADMAMDVLGKTRDSYTQRETTAIEHARDVLDTLDRRRGGLLDAEARTATGLAELAVRREACVRTAPGLLARLFRTQSARDHAAHVRTLKQQQQALEAQARLSGHELTRLEDEQRGAASALDAAQAALEARLAQWTETCEALAQLQKHRPDILIPRALDDIDDTAFQIRGLWLDKTITTLRTELFHAALALHEAWLAEVGRTRDNGGSGFRANLNALRDLLAAKIPLSGDQALLLWQSLFMVVPVVSTTFASFASQFRHLGRASLGWVFIDEAGQAVPQAAVGALWRAKTAVVVGDPLQIEPIFTVPSRLIRAIARRSPHTGHDEFAPHTSSVQRLADLGTSHGTRLRTTDGEQWVGSPLRVHRRCAEPMFSIANKIAYDGLMINALPPAKAQSAPARASAWIGIAGAADKRQAVPDQARFVATLLATHFARQGELPPAYVISPFRAVVAEIREALISWPWSAPQGQGRPGNLNAWCKDRIGTVHTFQGKEEAVVLMVLGADASTAGAARWASTKPNLLNVAVTRAKRRCFIIGDKDLWAKMPYFDTAFAELGPACAEELLDAFAAWDPGPVSGS